MSRINVYSASGFFAGWFQMDSIKGRWSDRDPMSLTGSGGVGRGQAVILTASGRWVLESWSLWSNDGPSLYQWITAADALDWLLRAGFDDVIREYFPDYDLSGEINLDERG